MRNAQQMEHNPQIYLLKESFDFNKISDKLLLKKAQVSDCSKSLALRLKALIFAHF